MENKKKKWVIAALLLFVVIGIAGYGVYSYYYTEGTMNTEEATSEDDDNVIRITGSFKPKVSQDSGINEFLGNGGTIDLSCDDNYVGVNEKTNCYATVHVYNEGTTPIRVSYRDVYANATPSGTSASVSTGTPSLRWSGSNNSYTTIDAGSSTDLYIDVDVMVGDSNNNTGDDPQLVTGPISEGTLSAYISFGLDAEQRTNNNN